MSNHTLDHYCLFSFVCLPIFQIFQMNFSNGFAYCKVVQVGGLTKYILYKKNQTQKQKFNGLFD